MVVPLLLFYTKVIKERPCIKGGIEKKNCVVIFDFSMVSALRSK